MNLNSLFQVQADLDKKIENEHKLQNQDLKKKKIVALLTELFECVNEARFFKFWSHDQKPRTWYERKCHSCGGKGYFVTNIYTNQKESCGYCDGTGFEEQKNPLLEEYVDMIHFILSVAIEYGYTKHVYQKPVIADLNDRVIDITYLISSLPYMPKEKKHNHLNLIFNYTIEFGYQLGFTEEQVIEAYYEKNKINHERQNTGY